MDNLWLQAFEHDIQAEVETLLDQVCEKKTRAWALVRETLAQEAALLTFIDQYEEHFRPFQLRLNTLGREETRLRRRLEACEHQDGLWIPSTHADTADMDDSLSPTVEPDDSAAQTAPANERINFEVRVSEPEPEEPPQVDMHETAPRPYEGAKRRIALMFLQMYHPRRTEHSGDSFMNERSALITQLMNNPLADAVEIMLRLPFDARDQAMWTKPLHTLSSGGVVESFGDRWYRLRLWDRLLDYALERAEQIAVAPPHPLYPKFEQMRRQNLPVLAYFQEIQSEIEQEINEMHTRVTRLCAEVERCEAEAKS